MQWFFQKRNQEEDEKREEPPKVTNPQKDHSVKESQECFKIRNNLNDHCDNVTESFNDSHVEEHFSEANEYKSNQD